MGVFVDQVRYYLFMDGQKCFKFESANVDIFYLITCVCLMLKIFVTNFGNFLIIPYMIFSHVKFQCFEILCGSGL